MELFCIKSSCQMVQVIRLQYKMYVINSNFWKTLFVCFYKLHDGELEIVNS